MRYTDDFVLLWRSEEEARAALGRVQRWVEANGLMLHPEKPASSMRPNPEVLTSWGITSNGGIAGPAARRWTG